MTPALAFNTEISFTTNTSWQNYPGESTLGNVGLAAGLGVQAFASCAVGMRVALIRGLAQYQNEELGNFWVDLVRSVVRVLLPLSIVVTVILIALGVVNNFNSAQEITTLSGGSQTIFGGAVGAWESIKLMSGDGGGAFNVNSAHPFENPTPLSNVVEIVAMLIIPVAFLRTFGVMIGDMKQSWALFAAAALFVIGVAATVAATSVAHGTVVHAVGAPIEGTETRFGVPGSALFGHVATASADGTANSSYDSFASLGGAVLTLNMMLGEVAPGGAGSGLQFSCQRRQCIRGVQRQYHLVQRGARGFDGHRPIPADHCGAGDLGYLRSPAAGGHHRRHAAHHVGHVRHADHRGHTAHCGVSVLTGARSRGRRGAVT
jgi:K+-transporting ATPase ATPase A chain